MASSFCPSNDLLLLLFVFSKVEAACSSKYSRADSIVDWETWINSDPDLLEDVASEKVLSSPLRSIPRATGGDGKAPTSFVSFGSALSEGWMLDFLGCQPFLVLKGTDNLSELINKWHRLPWSVRLFKKKLPGGDSRLGCNLDHTQLIFSEGGYEGRSIPLKCSQDMWSQAMKKEVEKRWPDPVLALLFLYQYPGTFIPPLHLR